MNESDKQKTILMMNNDYNLSFKVYEPNEADYDKAIAVIKAKTSSTVRTEIIHDFVIGRSLASEHFGIGMQIRNAIRKGKIYPKEEELPEHFYDQTWQVLFLAALDFSEDELNVINIESMLTSKDANCRWTGKTLLALYKDKKSLTELCAVELILIRFQVDPNKLWSWHAQTSPH